MLSSHEKQYHINVAAGDIGKYCILPGDPGRCEKIAAYLDNPHFVSQNREYCIWNGRLLGETVTVCSTGIGGPSASFFPTALAVAIKDAFSSMIPFVSIFSPQSMNFSRTYSPALILPHLFSRNALLPILGKFLN